MIGTERNELRVNRAVLTLDSARLLQILQLSDGLFPIGAFAFSDGLETAVQRAEVVSGDDVRLWLEHYVDAVFGDSEGPALMQAMGAFPADWQRLERLDHELTALRPSSETRASSRSLGLRLVKTCVALYPGRGLEDLLERIESGRCHGNVAVVHGVVFRVLGISEREALLAFAYSRLSGTASAALRLARVGQQEMQQALRCALSRVPVVVDAILDRPAQRLTSFVPMLDVCQMEHRHLYSRLFRS
jgi:urease accessory protein